MSGDVRPVRVGDVYRGITGNRMEVIDVNGDRCLLAYQGENYGEEPWWDESDGVARYLDLVVEGPARQDVALPATITIEGWDGGEATP